jgi:hypothetical protein
MHSAIKYMLKAIHHARQHHLWLVLAHAFLPQVQPLEQHTKAMRPMVEIRLAAFPVRPMYGILL